MAGVINKTARQFNLKTMTPEGHRVVVRLVPGMNSVKDEHWKAFVPAGNKKADPYVAQLKEEGKLDWGSKYDDSELDATESKSKSEPKKQVKKAD